MIISTRPLGFNQILGFKKKYEFELEFDGKRIAVLLKQENGKIESKIHNETTRKVLIIKQI